MRKYVYFLKNHQGQLLVEALLVVALAAIILPALFAGFITSREGKAQEVQRIQSTALLKEAEEAVRSVREKGWSSFSNTGTYHPEILGSAWSLVPNSEVLTGYTRSVVISDVYRDSSGVIVQSGGGLDPSTKKVEITVSWQSPRPSSVSSTLYLTHFANTAITQTTQSDFNTGTPSGTVITNVSGGEVTLGAGGGGGDWCNPTLSITTVDLSRQGVPTSIGAYPGNIVTGTGGNASGPTFVKTRVVGNSPPAATFIGQFNNSKANGVFTEGNYGYIATTNNSQEIQILDLTSYSNPPTNTNFTQSGYFDAPGNTQGNSIFVSGTKGYMTAANKFYIFDLSSHSGSRTQLNPTAVTLAGTGNKIVVVGNYAYVAVDSTTTQLQVINVSNPASPSIVASANVGNNKAGVDVSVNSTGTRAYIITDYVSSSVADFFIINTTTKSGSLPTIGTGFNTNGMFPKGVAVATGNRAIIVGTGGVKQYQVLNISNESSPITCGSGLTITNGAYAIATVLQSDGFAYSYITTGDANAELKMILGGAGGQYTTTGAFISDAYNAGSQVTFNALYFTADVPAQTTLQLQVAATDPVNGSCTNASYSFVGPDGTSSSYFTASGSMPLSSSGAFKNPAQCFKYKAILSTSDQTQTPILYDVSINYSL